MTLNERNLDEVAQLRRLNYSRLSGWLDEPNMIRPVFGSLPDGVCPYAFAVTVITGAGGVCEELQAAGVPASRWPDLPPEVLACPDEHAVAIDVYNRLLLLPINQGLDAGHIDYVGRKIQSIMGGASGRVL